MVYFRLQVVGSIRSGMGSKLKEAHTGVFIMRGVWIFCGGLTNTIRGELQQFLVNVRDSVARVYLEPMIGFYVRRYHTKSAY